MVGTRVYPNDEGWLDPMKMRQPGAYGKLGEGEALDDEKPDSPQRWWLVTAPSGEQGSLNPEKHQIIEHDDGTITVTPSIYYQTWPGEKWHGFLKAGIWTSV